jgi:sugar phosphate isomerase/epimerase
MSGKDRHVFEKYPEKLCHMHLHDSDGKHAHLPLGEGVINVGEKLTLLNYDTTCLVEVKTVAGLEKSVKFLKKNNYMR